MNVRRSFPLCLCLFSHSVVPDSSVSWTVARQASLSMGFPRQEYWSRLPFPSPGDLPDPGIGPELPASHADSLLIELRWKPRGCVGAGSLEIQVSNHAAVLKPWVSRLETPAECLYCSLEATTRLVSGQRTGHRF